VRQAQVPVILKFWNEGSSTVFLGDLNATPDSPEMKLISKAGMLDAWIEAGVGPGFTDASTNPVKRIDWIWTSPDLETSAIEVIQTQASDQMPVLAELYLAPQKPRMWIDKDHESIKGLDISCSQKMLGNLTIIYLIIKFKSIL